MCVDTLRDNLGCAPGCRVRLIKPLTSFFRFFACKIVQVVQALLLFTTIFTIHSLAPSLFHQNADENSQQPKQRMANKLTSNLSPVA